MFGGLARGIKHRLFYSLIIEGTASPDEVNDYLVGKVFRPLGMKPQYPIGVLLYNVDTKEILFGLNLIIREGEGREMELSILLEDKKTMELVNGGGDVWTATSGRRGNYYVFWGVPQNSYLLTVDEDVTSPNILAFGFFDRFYLYPEYRVVELTREYIVPYRRARPILPD